jgi:hypothetical protein
MQQPSCIPRFVFTPVELLSLPVSTLLYETGNPDFSSSTVNIIHLDRPVALQVRLFS